jgi:hypothetical protein
VDACGGIQTLTSWAAFNSIRQSAIIWGPYPSPTAIVLAISATSTDRLLTNATTRCRRKCYHRPATIDPVAAAARDRMRASQNNLLAKHDKICTPLCFSCDSLFTSFYCDTVEYLVRICNQGSVVVQSTQWLLLSARFSVLFSLASQNNLLARPSSPHSVPAFTLQDTSRTVRDFPYSPHTVPRHSRTKKSLRNPCKLQA